MHRTLKQRYEGLSIKDVSKSGGGSGVSRGGGAKFQLLLGYRRSHKGKFMFPKKVAKNICVVEAKKSQLQVSKGGGKFRIRPGRQTP